MKEIVPFDVIKINRGKTKICRCKLPHYEIDTENRLVMCMDCGAIVEAFEALTNIAERMEEIENIETEMKETVIHYKTEAQKMIKNRVFRTMEDNYRKSMFPICPKCNEPINPTEINHYARSEYDLH